MYNVSTGGCSQLTWQKLQSSQDFLILILTSKGEFSGNLTMGHAIVLGHPSELAPKLGRASLQNM